VVTFALEPTAASVEENRDGVRGMVRRDQVRSAVSVHVGCREGVGPFSGCVALRGRERRPTHGRGARAGTEHQRDADAGDQNGRGGHSHVRLPLLTTSSTFPPPGSTAPNLGFCEITLPFGQVLHARVYTRVTFPTRQLTRASLRFAARSVIYLMSCTLQRPGVFSSTETVPTVFAVTTSGLSSPFRSAVTTETGLRLVRYSSVDSKLPSPLLGSTETMFPAEFPVARSGLPSPFRSPMASLCSELPSSYPVR